MGCGCNKGRTGNSQQRTAVYRQNNMAAPQQSFSPPVPQQQPAAPVTNIIYNVQNVSAPTPNAQTNEHVRRIAWDRSRRDAIRRSLGR